MTTNDPYPNAGRDSGYTDEEGKPVGENIINRVTELMVGPQTKLVQLSAQLDAAVKIQDQRFQYVLGQLGAFLDKEDARHSAYDLAEQSTLQALTSVAHRLDEITSYVQQSVTIAREALTVAKAGAARLGKLDKDVRQLKRAMSESKDDRGQLHVEVAEVKADVAALQARIDAEFERRLAALEARGDGNG